MHFYFVETVLVKNCILMHSIYIHIYIIEKTKLLLNEFCIVMINLKQELFMLPHIIYDTHLFRINRNNLNYGPQLYYYNNNVVE